MAQIDPAAQQAAVAASALEAKYGETIDRDSAYERLAARLAPPPVAEEPTPEAPAPAPAPKAAPKAKPAKPKPSVVESVLQSSAFKSFTRSAATVLGREISRGIFGTRKR